MDPGTLILSAPAALRAMDSTGSPRAGVVEGRRDDETPVNAHLFKDLAVNQYPEIMQHQGQYPVIWLTFKDIKTNNWAECYSMLTTLIGNEFRRHNYLLQSQIDDSQKKNFQDIIDRTADQATYATSLKDLSAYLNAYHKKPAIILIDEYDMPIVAGYTFGYYDDVVCFLRNFLSGGLKDNSNLAYGAMTGIVRIAMDSTSLTLRSPRSGYQSVRPERSKPSANAVEWERTGTMGCIFSGLNNIKVCSLANDAYADKFGLIENEVLELLAHYNLATSIDDVRAWYNGYSSGSSTKVYNPWSIINCARNKGSLEPYWINTSSNDLIKQLMQEGSCALKEDLELVLQRKPLTKALDHGFVFPELTKRDDAVWNLLFYSGYLTVENKRLEQRTTLVDFVIPNEEVLSFFETSIQHWFIGSSAIGSNYQAMLNALTSGDIETFASAFQKLVVISLSSFDVGGDEPERFYHALVLGMLMSLGGTHEVRSNRESGYGRYDVMIIPRDTTKLGIILEFKKVDPDINEDLEKAVVKALKQINDRQYEVELHNRGIKQMLKLGIAFHGKKILVKQG